MLLISNILIDTRSDRMYNCSLKGIFNGVGAGHGDAFSTDEACGQRLAHGLVRDSQIRESKLERAPEM